jgi:hypothetical protein
VLEGPSGLPAPVLPAPTGEDTHAPDTTEQQRVIWRFEDDVIEHETRAVTAYGSSYDGPFDASIEERYEGSVGVSTDDPANAWARGLATYRIAWPEMDVQTEARLDLRSDAGAYYVVVDVVAEELGADTDVSGFRRERRFERTIPRRLA